MADPLNTENVSLACLGCLGANDENKGTMEGPERYDEGKQEYMEYLLFIYHEAMAVTFLPLRFPPLSDSTGLESNLCP